MNYLLHLYLSDPEPHCLLGNLMGDFVKGRLDPTLPPGILKGLRQHRSLDRFAHTCPAFVRSRDRIDPAFGLYRGILVDLFYDHALALNWDSYCAIPLEHFASDIYSIMESHRDQLPDPLRRYAPRMIADNWLVRYREPEAIERAINRVAARHRRPLALAGAMGQLVLNRGGFEQDCGQFIEMAKGFLALP